MQTILVIDDDSLCLQIVVRHLARNGFRVIHTADSTEALMLILQEHPAAIITDIEMPGLDGWELIRVVRSWTKTALIPVIFLTQLGAEADRMRGFRLGADDYLVKPVAADRLLVQVECVLDSTQRYLRTARARLKAGERFSESTAMFGIPSLLSLLEELRLTGRVEVESAEGPGVLEISGGRVFHAALPERPEVGSLVSAREIVGWTLARYTFTPGVVHAADLVAVSTTQLLVEAATAGGDGPAAVGLKPSRSGRRCAITRAARVVA